MTDTYGIELDLRTAMFKKQVEDTKVQIAQLQRTIQILQNEMKYTEPGTQAFKTYAIEIDKAKQELKDLEEELDRLKGKSKGITLGDIFKKAERNSRKFLLSLFSIRSIWALVSRVSRTYISNNDEMNAKTQLLSSIMGNTLAPVIKKVVDLAEYAFIIGYKIVGLFINLPDLSTIASKSIDKVGKSAKKASKQLAGFDTITNLSSDAGSSIGGITGQASALSDFLDKVKKIEEVFEEYEPLIKTATEALLIFAGASMIKKLAKLIGGEKMATGLLGVKGALGLIAGLSVITIIVNGLYLLNDYKDLLKDIKTARDKLDDKNDKFKKSTDKEIESIKKLQNSGKDASKEIDTLNEHLEQQTTDLLVNQNGVDGTRDAWERLTGNLSDSTKKAYKDISDSVYDTTNKLKNQYDQGNITKDGINKYTDSLKNGIETLKKQNEKLDKNSEQYKTNKKRIDEMRESLKKVTGKDYKVELKTDIKTNKLKDKLKKIYTSIGHKLMGAIIPGLPTFSTITKFINSFDVGTNYVPNDQLAMVHKGEMIVPAKYNPTTSGIGNNEETNYLLNRLINVVESIEPNTYLDGQKITNTVVKNINYQSRIMGESVVK